MKRKEQSLEERTAKVLLCWIGLHILLYGLLLGGGPAVVAIPALLAYGLCVVRMDGLLRTGGDGENIRLMRNYWLAASVCMPLWLFWAEPLLAGCDGVAETLLLGLVVPYAVNLSCELGWAADLLPREACRVCQYILLALCAGHAAYYLRLSGSRRVERSGA